MKAKRVMVGDIVRVADTLPAFMRHFDGAGEEALVVEEHVDGGEFALYFKEYKWHAWYGSDLLTVLKKGPAHKWIKDKKRKDKKRNDKSNRR